MAGIGFELNKLARRDDLLGIAGAYLHSAFAIAGPWLFTVAALALTTLIYGDSDNAALMNFRGVIIYNFSFSLVLSAPVYFIVTRALADQIHVKNVTCTPTAMLDSLLLVFVCNLAVGIFFYGFYFTMPLALRLAGFANLFLIAAVWLLAVFLTALKNFSAVTWSFILGMAVAVAAAEHFAQYGAAGMALGYDIGLAIIVFLLAGRIFSEYPYHMSTQFSLIPFWKKYWELAVGGFCYNAALWVDKWLMWFSPESVALDSGLRFFPDYDSAMFIAALTILPSIALFVFSIETSFFHHYRRFYSNILAHASLRRIRIFHRHIIAAIAEGARSILVVQGVIAFLFIMLAPQLFERIGLLFVQLGIFRLGVLGSFFQVLVLFTTIILSYFDCRRATMGIFMFYLASNAILTLIFMQQGYEFYGYGFFLSSALTFFLAASILISHVRKLPYHAFISNNNSVTRRTAFSSDDRNSNCPPL